MTEQKREKDQTLLSGAVEGSVADFLIENTKNLKGRIFVLAYKHHEIQIGLIEEDGLKMDNPSELGPKYLKELRAFSKNGELYIWSVRGGLRYRLRIDPDGQPENVYDEVHCMWGNRRAAGDEIYEANRGMRFRFPVPVQQEQLPLQYTVRNYYDFDENGLIQFNDARLAGFLDASGKEL